MHAGQAGDQAVGGPGLSARGQIHCELLLHDGPLVFLLLFVISLFARQIPLSGYGGTSNIILEEQRKQADGYVATLTDVAAGHVSKVCLSVRNTGSRAAFIKAVAFSDLTTRTPMEPTVLSLAPSQFILKERTQEVRAWNPPALIQVL